MGNIYDVAVLGGGILGTSAAMALLRKDTPSLIILEEEKKLAFHQSGRNSGVVHAGIYYLPGSLKARFCTLGREALYRFCSKEGIPYDICGKLVVAANEREETLLQGLEDRGRQNGLTGHSMLSRSQMKGHEPQVSGRCALLVPQTGIVDFSLVTRTFGRIVSGLGGEIRLGTALRSVEKKEGVLSLSTNKGEVRCRFMVNCGGLFSDRIARMYGASVPMRIIPFRGEYYRLKGSARNMVSRLVYPVPDPDLPFLGVHLTKMIDGEILAGPNAVLATSRKGYKWSDFSLRDTRDILGYRGFWRLAARHSSIGLGEIYRSLRKEAFLASLRKLLPHIEMNHLEPAPSGVRGQAVSPEGRLVDDFVILEDERAIHVLNAPSPAATSSIPIGEHIAEKILERL
jgi:L-2-hydroxyglutarate oxidase